MKITNPTLLYEAFQMYYKDSIAAKERGDLVESKNRLLRAAEALYGLAKHSEGELRQTMVSRADRLVFLANNMVEGDSVSLTTAPKGVKNQSKPKSGDSNPKSQDDTETEWAGAKIPSIRFDDVAGLSDVKEAVNRKVIIPMRHPDVYKKWKKKTGGGILMVGPPGTGKTMVAKAIANEVGAKFFEVKCSDIMSKWVGVAETNVKNLFETARKEKYAVIFFDEIEALATQRGDDNSVMKRLVPELLAQIQGFGETSNTLLLLAATNRPQDIDTAFLRPGRFDEIVYVSLPDDDARKWIIEKEFKDFPISAEVDIDELVSFTAGFNAADVVAFCQRVTDGPAFREIEGKSIGEEEIKVADIDCAKARSKSSVAQSDIDKLEMFLKNMNRL
jgi:transitional endoplasmic reticulum ATPase